MGDHGSDAPGGRMPVVTAPRARESEVDAAIRLLLVPGIGVGRLRQLRLACGGFARALSAEPSEVAAAIRVEPAEAARLVAMAREQGGAAADAREALARVGADFRLLEDDRYPELLRASPDPPETLFVRGALPREPEPAVAIVGSRRATAYGRLEAGRLSSELAERGIVVVSGGARGIDAEAHRGAMRAGGRTISVFAPGFGHPYPDEHRPLFDAILESGGALITEQLAHVTARPELFPRRNRIIAGLALVTVVVEAANRSGALLTARLAVDDLSRDAACMPGPVGSPQSAGCHRAIREGWATLVTGAQDVCEILYEARHLLAGATEAAAGVGAGAHHAGGLGESAPPARTDRIAPSSRSAMMARAQSTRQCAPQFHPTAGAPSDEIGISCDAEAIERSLRRRGRAVLDELSDELGWEISRTTLALLELERAERICREPQGGFTPRRGVK